MRGAHSGKGDVLGAASAILTYVTTMSGWRAGLVVVLGLVVLSLLLTALFWIGVLLAVVGGLAWFNLLVLPRLAARARLPETVLALGLLPVLGALGLLLHGSTGLAAGGAVWALGVALPRAAVWRLRRRLRGPGTRRPMPVRVIEPEYRHRP